MGGGIYLKVGSYETQQKLRVTFKDEVQEDEVEEIGRAHV